MSPDRWLAVTALTDEAQARDLLADALVEAGGRAVLEEEGRLTTHFPAPPDPVAFTESLAAMLEAAVAAPVELTTRVLAQEDWAESWKRGLRPRRITDRILITPSWEAHVAEPGVVVITIDPKMAFGTAEHATTRGCLRLLDRAVSPGERIVDVGTGSAILAVAAAALGAASVLAMDGDPVACDAARENVAENEAGAKVRVIERLADPGTIGVLDRPHGIVANIESGILTPLVPAFADVLLPGGWLILSGILEEEAEVMRARVSAAGLDLVAEDREDGWWSAWFRKLPDVTEEPAS